jgi:hypothetical protein
MVQEGQYVAEVEVIETDDAWSPYLTPEDAYKLDDVREPLKQGDVRRANEIGQVYKLEPVSS